MAINGLGIDQDPVHGGLPSVVHCWPVFHHLCDPSVGTAMNAPRKLRPYQMDAVLAVRDYWQQPGLERYTPVVVLPTGTGKSTVIARLAVDAGDLGLRVVMLAHRAELLDQMADSVVAVDPTRPRPGIVQGHRNDPTGDIVAASFQTLTANPRKLQALGTRHVVLVDEMHHSAASTYKAVLRAFGVLDTTTAVACGFTATATRSDGGLGTIWDSIVYERSLKWAIKQGYLVVPRGLSVVVPNLDLSSVTIRSGDYVTGELEKVMESSAETTVDAIERHAVKRRMIVFAAGVDHAESLASQLSARGIHAAAVTGAHTRHERAVNYDAFRRGELRALVTVQVLTEGADFPMCDCVVMARPTRSQTLYSQMVGRALRLHDGKTDALVLDLAGSARDMSLVTLPDLHADAAYKRVSSTSDDDPGQDDVVEKVERVQRTGVANLEDIDLLGSSPANWLSTHKGVRFLDCGDQLVFLLPPNPADCDPSELIVGQLGKAGKDQSRNGSLPDRFDSLADAMERAESLAGADLPDRAASWRSRSKPSDAQVNYARTLGVPFPDKKTRARLSDDISIASATRRIDKYI